MACSRPIGADDDISRLISSDPPSYNFLSTLPLGAHSFFLSAARGAVADTMRPIRRNQEEVVKYLRPQHLIDIPIVVLADNVRMTEKLIAKLATIALVGFYNFSRMDDKKDPRLELLLASYIIILASYTTQASMETSGTIRAFEECGYRLVFNVKTEAELDVNFQKAWVFLKRPAQLTTFDDSIKILIVVSLSILLFMSKHLHEAEKAEKWFRNIWRAIAAMVGYVVSMDGIVQPILKNCNAIHTVLSSIHRPRNHLFKLIRALAQGPTKYSAVFEVIITKMEWAECIHIAMIHEHIVQKNEKILSFSEFYEEKYNLERAYKFLMTLPEKDRPFVMMLHDNNYTNVLHQRHFQNLYTAARAIAFLESNSIEQIETARKKESAQSAPLFMKVIGYMKAKEIY